MSIKIETIPKPLLRSFADRAVEYCNSDPRFTQRFDHNHLSGAILLLLQNYDEAELGPFEAGIDDLNLVRDIMFALCGQQEAVDRRIVLDWVDRPKPESVWKRILSVEWQAEFGS